MIPLSPIIHKNGYSYTQVYRGLRSCIYEQHVTPSVTYYEVFLIKISREKCINDKIIEARERFPRDEDFGYSAWTFSDFEKALRRYNELEKGDG